MSRAGEAQVAHAVRVLASPVFVLALVTLILNDHVLKQAWPGPVTGKLSDVAGLVVAPLLLAVPLAAMRVRRTVPVAAALTGTGFVLAKTSVAGAAATSAVWSLAGIPTLIRADVTDLVALPALGLAWWADRRVRRSPALPWRRAVAVATGMAILPVAVLATAATSCDEGTRVTDVARVEGDFHGRPRRLEQRLVLAPLFSTPFTIDDARTIEREHLEVSPPDLTVTEQCDPTDPTQCWRILPDVIAVEHSVDGGRTWESELDLSEDEVEALQDDVNDCGGTGQIAALDLAVLPTEGEPIVVVPIDKGGAYIRDEGARWERYSVKRLLDVPTVADGTVNSRPQVKPLDQPSEAPTPVPSGPATTVTPTCANPTPTTVTPNPSNGPPTTYDVCP